MIRYNLDIPVHSDVSKNLSERFHNYINITKEFVKEGCTSYGRSFHATFALEHNKVLNVGFNDYRMRFDWVKGLGRVKHFDDPISQYKMCKHSELDSIMKLGRIDYSSISFFNVHLDKGLHCKLSKPCPNCLYTLMKIGAKKIYFYDEKDKTFKYIKL